MSGRPGPQQLVRSPGWQEVRDLRRCEDGAWEDAQAAGHAQATVDEKRRKVGCQRSDGLAWLAGVLVLVLLPEQGRVTRSIAHEQAEVVLPEGSPRGRAVLSVFLDLSLPVLLP